MKYADALPARPALGSLQKVEHTCKPIAPKIAPRDFSAAVVAHIILWSRVGVQGGIGFRRILQRLLGSNGNSRSLTLL